MNYLNDETFARNWAQRRREDRLYGPKKIEQELRQKGIAAPLIRDVVRQSFAEGDEEESAKSLIERRFRGQDLEDPKVLRRAIAFLQRRGYNRTVIADLLKGRLEDD